MKWMLGSALMAVAVGMAARVAAREVSEPWAFTAPTPRTAQQMPADTTAPADLGQEARDAYNTAVSALASQDVSRAALAIQQAMIHAPDNPSVVSLAGRIFTRQRSFGLAANCWRQLLSAYPGSATLRAEWGATLLYMGKDQEARPLIEGALAASPGDLTARYYQGLLLVRDRAFDKAAENFAPLNGFQILQTIRRLQEDRELITTLSSSEGYRNMARAVMNAKTGSDTEAVLDQVRKGLESLQPLMMQGDWARAEPQLQALYEAGARFPALEYDLGLCRYGLRPGPEPLDALEKLVVSPRGLGFRRFFAYLCFQQGDAGRAERAVGEFLKNEPDVEALLLRAAIRQGLQDNAGAWALLATIPAEQRPGTRPWFDRPFPFVQQLKQDARFEAWLASSENE